MSGKHAVPCFQQFFVAGEISSVKRPVRVIVQFLVAFVKPIRRSKKRHRIGNVNGHWYIELTADVPHGIESWIVDLYQGSGGGVFPQIKSERFENFQASCPITLGPLNRFRLNSWIIRLLEAGINRFSEGVEAPGDSAIIFA